MTKKVKTVHGFTVFLLNCFLLSGFQGWSQNKPVITVDQPVHDFGSIQEKDGEAAHTFVVKNTGNAPLTISQIVASRDCTAPQWPEKPIEAGQTGNIRVLFNPAGQSGAFEKTIHIYSDALPEPYMLTVKGNVSSKPEGEPVFTIDDPVFDFGFINEEDIDAIHVFRVKNTGTAPLVISHVQSSCGCMEPEWTKDPIAPGKMGDVVITYVAKNRPGPFAKNITVYTNEKKFRQRLTIKGDVIPVERNLTKALSDTIGIIQIEYKSFTFTLHNGQEQTQSVWIKNFSGEDATLSLSNIPPFLAAEAPGQLKSGAVERFKITASGNGVDVKGRVLHLLEWKMVTASGKTRIETIPVAINFVDDFSKMTAAEKQSGAEMQLSEEKIDFGILKASRGFLGLGSNKKASRQITVTNTGQSPLALHSATCDDPKLLIDIDKKTLQPTESATLTVSLKPADVRQSFAKDIIIICNDHRGPVRNIGIYAERGK
ncbi:MAG: DUF1573 domain-containing protein [Tannerella sp.]|jgi:hypothetical protein|nr:DUF1573 domain-containing protein [Tannerella sp.]